MSIKKQYLKNKPVCKVTFSLPKKIVKSAKTVHLVGDFNDWDQQAASMKKLKDGSFKITLELETGREYQFRYLIDGTDWENDWNANKYVPNPFGDSDNSVVVV